LSSHDSLGIAAAGAFQSLRQADPADGDAKHPSNAPKWGYTSINRQKWRDDLSDSRSSQNVTHMSSLQTLKSLLPGGVPCLGLHGGPRGRRALLYERGTLQYPMLMSSPAVKRIGHTQDSQDQILAQTFVIVQANAFATFLVVPLLLGSRPIFSLASTNRLEFQFHSHSAFLLSHSLLWRSLAEIPRPPKGRRPHLQKHRILPIKHLRVDICHRRAPPRHHHRDRRPPC